MMIFELQSILRFNTVTLLSEYRALDVSYTRNPKFYASKMWKKCEILHSSTGRPTTYPVRYRVLIRMKSSENKCFPCSRCCFLPVEIVECIDELVPDHLTEWKDDGHRKMRQHENGACIALQEDGACGIYSVRPLECRQFQRGGSECLKLKSL